MTSAVTTQDGTLSVKDVEVALEPSGMGHVHRLQHLLSEAHQVVEEAPAAFGASRVYIDNVAQMWALSSLILRSFELSKASKDESATQETATPTAEPPPSSMAS